MFDPLEVCRKDRKAIQLKYNFNQDCTICHETMFKKCVKYLECEHVYHLKCINKWLNKSDTCPICRRCTKHKESENEDFEDENYSRILNDFLDEIYQTISNVNNLNSANQQT